MVDRDLKTENVLVADDGQGGFTIKLIDFGLARSMLSDSSEEIPASDHPSPVSKLQRHATGALKEHGNVKFQSSKQYTAPELASWRPEFGTYGELVALACRV